MNAKVWLLAARPKTLWASAAPVLIGTALAYDAGVFHAPSALSALIGAMLIQIGTNYANDYFDYVKGTDTSDRIGPTRATQAGLVTPRAMLTATLFAFALAFLPGLYIVMRGGLPFVVVGILSILCGILYTAGPVPLGYVGLGDLFVLIFFGPVAVGGTYYLQALSIHPDVVVAGLAPGLLSVALLTVNNLRDIDQDRAAGKRTLAVRFGRGFARVEYVVALLTACVLIPIYLMVRTGGHGLVLVSVLALALGLPAVWTVWTRTEGPALNGALGMTGGLLLLFSVLFSIGWVL